MDRRENGRRGVKHQHDLRLDRLGLRGALGGGQGGGLEPGAVVGLGVGQVWNSPERDRAWFVSDRRRLVAAEAGRVGRRQGKPERIPLGRYGEHAELSNLAAYLLSDFAAYITGACVTIDGGAWLRGAGQFNALERVTSEQWDSLQAAMRPAKK